MTYEEEMNDEVKRLKASLPEGHVIHTMITEHEFILGFLDELEKTNLDMQKRRTFSEDGQFKRFQYIAKHLAGAEPHHEREEKVLFPELEKRGVFGPPQIMRMEHVELRRRKKELVELSENHVGMNFDVFKERLDTTSKSIVLSLRDHIFKENNILYPAALQMIPESDMWAKMKEECDKIGYCCFTPQL